MRTEDLIASLAEGARPVPRRTIDRRLAIALAAGGAATIAIVLLWLGPRPDLAIALRGPTIWMKWGYTVVLAAVALIALRGLSRPEAHGAAWLWAAIVPIGLLAAIATVQLSLMPPGRLEEAWLGHSWRHCAAVIVLLSAPVFAGLVWAFGRCAPTRLRLAGAAAGLLAGGAAASLYGFACPETSALFVVTWYTLGIAAMTGVGALTGPRLLRW